MEKTKISVIMGIYNCEKYLEEAINSIVNQTYNNWELIMCDDGSTDNTVLIAEKCKRKFHQNKIVLLKNKENMGLNYTLNKCLKIAEGEYIARQDGDDISIPSRFEKEINFLENHTDYSFVSSNMIYFDENGEWGKSNLIQAPLKKDFALGTPFCHAPSMIRKEVIEQVGGYTIDKKLLRVEDYDLWFKLYAKGYKGYNISEALYKMRDDREAVKRRNFQNRINEARVKLKGFRMIKMPIIYYIYVLKPLLIGMLPTKIYMKLHRYKLKEK